MFNTANALNSKPFKASYVHNRKNSKAFKNSEIKAVGGKNQKTWAGLKLGLEAHQPVMRPVCAGLLR